MIEIERLTSVDNMSGFDCGDSDLNDFIQNDAYHYQEKRIATTYLVLINEEIVAYYSLLNDKISRTDVSKSAWRKLKKLFAHNKHRSNYQRLSWVDLQWQNHMLVMALVR